MIFYQATVLTGSKMNGVSMIYTKEGRHCYGRNLTNMTLYDGDKITAIGRHEGQGAIDDVLEIACVALAR